MEKYQGCYTVKEAQNYLRIGTTKMCDLMKQPGFPCIRLGRRIIIPVVELNAWLTEQARKN